jgi:hypothetical protein
MSIDPDAEAFKLIAELDIGMVTYIVFKINQDGYRHNFGKDNIWIRRARNVGFLIMAFMLCAAIWRDGNRESVHWLFYSASYSIYVNCLALHFRK